MPAESPLKTTGEFNAEIGSLPSFWLAQGTNALHKGFDAAVGSTPITTILTLAEGGVAEASRAYSVATDLNTLTHWLQSLAVIFESTTVYIRTQSTVAYAGVGFTETRTDLNGLMAYLRSQTSVAAIEWATLNSDTPLNEFTNFTLIETALVLGGEVVVRTDTPLNELVQFLLSATLVNIGDDRFLEVIADINSLGALLHTATRVSPGLTLGMTAELRGAMLEADTIHIATIVIPVLPLGGKTLSMYAMLKRPVPSLSMTAWLVSGEIITIYFGSSPTGTGTSSDPRYGDIQRPFGSVN